MRLGDEWKITFNIRNGLHKWMVILLGLSNAPSNLMWLINHAFKLFNGKFTFVYFDDIFVYDHDKE